MKKLTLMTYMVAIATCLNAQVSTANNFGANTDYVGWNAGQAFPLFIKHEAPDQPIVFQPSGFTRMAIMPNVSSTINGTNVNQRGHLGIGIPTQFLTGGSAKGPFSLIHLNGDNLLAAPQELGYRDWMRYGISYTHNQDFMYVGPRAVQEDDYTRAVISWSDNAEGASGPDDFSFLFIDENAAEASGTLAGREVMRLTGTGNVGIADFQNNGFGLNTQPAARLHVSNDNSPGAPEQSGNSTAVLVRHACDAGLNRVVDVQSQTLLSGNHTGIRSRTSGGSKNIAGEFLAVGVFENADEAYGIFADAFGLGMSELEDVYGIYGRTRGDVANAYSIYGQQTANVQPGGANWAAYFNGAGFLNTGPWVFSDSTLKRDIQPIENALAVLMDINPRTYHFDTDAHPNLVLDESIHYGILAQEVQELLPGLIREARTPAQRDSLGEVVHPESTHLAIDYSGLIPFLIQGVKEQQAEIDNLNQRLSEMEALMADIAMGRQLEMDDSKRADRPIQKDYELYQNRPNPFSTNTEIVWKMAQDASCRILVHDGSGNLVQVLQDGSRTEGLHSLIWDASDLRDGTYYYSLEVEGELLIKKAVKIQR